MSQANFIKFCGFIVHSYPNNMTVSDFLGKIVVPIKIFYFLSVASPNVALIPTDQCCSNSIFKVLLQLSPTRPFHFGPTLNIKSSLMLRVVHSKNQETTWVKNIEFYKRNCFCCYVIKLAGETAKKALLSLIYQSSEIYCL